MADTKISALTALAGTDVSTSTDVLPIVDTSVATTKKILVDELRIAMLSATMLTNSLSGDVALNNTANFFEGPVVSQGTTGVWFASGAVTVNDTGGAARFYAKLWDGTTVIDSGSFTSSGSDAFGVIALSGFISSPAGNIRISVRDISLTTGVIISNVSGGAKDSTVSVVRVG